MIIKKSASWISDYEIWAYNRIESVKTEDLDIRLGNLLKLRDEINKQIQIEIDMIYDTVAKRIKLEN
jgi:hypothetical protein